MTQSSRIPPPVMPMPKGVFNIYLFEIFNTISYTVVLGAPMLLFLKRMDASTFLLSLASSLSPVLNILQLPAARFVEQVGYKKFVLSGWTARSILVIGMSAIAFLPDQSYGQVEWVDRTTRMAVFFVLLVLYNVMRGFSVCGVLPWFTHIIPESRRGEFLAKDQFAAAVGTILSTIGYAAMLTGRGNWYAFGSLFTISAIAAFHSLSYLHRIPDVPVHAVPVNNEARPWAEMLFYPPFLRYIIYNMVINFACGAAGVFWVPFFRDALGVTESGVMLSACFTSVVLAASLYFFGSQIDRVGNKPILILSALVLILHFAGWAAIGAHLVRFNTLTLAWQCMTSGIGGALWNLANVRMVIGIIPVMGRAHFLALYSVIFNVTFGLAPLLLAPAMDHLDKIHWNCTIGLWTWNSYSLLYTLLSAIIGLGLALLLRIPEPGSMSWEEFTRELFVKTPSRGISRLIGRWRGTGV